MSQAKLSELKEAFKLFDEDCDGMISCKELKSLIAKIGGELPDVEAEALIKAADKDGNNLIDFKGKTVTFFRVSLSILHHFQLPFLKFFKSLPSCGRLSMENRKRRLERSLRDTTWITVGTSP